jgi:hypothetical protein
MKKLSPWLLIVAACGGTSPAHEPLPPPVVETEHPAVVEARQNLKTVLDLHTTVISRSCGPTGGVCHNGKEYPDLRTTGSLIASLSKPCNKDRFDEPGAIFDGCEVPADELVVSNGAMEWKTKIGYLGPEEFDDTRQTTYRHLKLAQPAPRLMDRTSARIERNGRTLVTLPQNILVNEGSQDGRILDTYLLEYTSVQALLQVRGGDPNQNGIFGADQPWELIAPGHPDRSYLIGRITGTVPGTRMPLANHPLLDSEYVALICWIETMNDDPRPRDAIDYDGCQFAKNPISYQVGRR